MPLRWTFDERVEDGLVAGYALKRAKQMLEDPVAAGLPPIEDPTERAGSS
jgi:pyruvate/2-oxoglutarate dehydrogenase complex dihydrolipoamide acyltransferase (E2) component